MEIIRFVVYLGAALLVLGGVCWGASAWVNGRREARHLRKAARQQQKRIRG